jgi:nucleotide-binding universal stress UspA family protein
MDTILAPTDFSPAANNAVNYAAELAKFFDAKLVLINAYSMPPVNYEAGFALDIVASLQKASQEQLEALKKQLLQKNQFLKIECEVEMGIPYDVIQDAVKKYNTDLIVMGIVGEAGKIKEHVIGSSAVRVARHIETPTFIIPENVRYHKIHHISFACDLEKTEETVLVYIAKYFSKMFDADLEIVNVERPQEELNAEKSKTSVFIEKKLETINHKTVYITENKVAKGLEDYFESHPTDVIMLNPKKHNLFHNLFNESVTKELAFHVKQPILSIH